MIEINISNKENIYPMIKSFVETNNCKKILIYTETDQTVVVKEESNNFVFKKEVADVLKTIGYPIHVSGYKYLIKALEMYVNNGFLKNYISSVYPEIAEEFNTTAHAVERCIRHGIGVSWKKGNPEALKQIFGYDNTSNSNPVNSEFIASIGEYLISRKEKSIES